jgi:hypothetical protein
MLLPVRQWVTFELHQIHIMVSLSVRLSAVTSNSVLSGAYIHIQHLAMGRGNLREFACKISEHHTGMLLVVVACWKASVCGPRWTLGATCLKFSYLDF